jgi:hypothetical protein
LVHRSKWWGTWFFLLSSLIIVNLLSINNILQQVFWNMVATIHPFGNGSCEIKLWKSWQGFNGWTTWQISKPWIDISIVATLALGSQPRQGVARLRAKRKTQESHHMLPGVPRMWGNEPSNSQVNSHVGSWSRKWTLKFSKCNCRGQNPLP